MKFHIHIFVMIQLKFVPFFLQLSSSHVMRRDDSTIESVRNHMKQMLGASNQFIDDVDVVLREFPSNAFVIESLDGFVSDRINQKCN